SASTLSSTFFSDANLRGAILYDAIATYAHFDGADLVDAVLYSAYADYAHFDGADLSGADAYDFGASVATCVDATVDGLVSNGSHGACELCRFDRASLIDADLTDNFLLRAKAPEAVFDGATLDLAQWREGDLTGASLVGASCVG